jgi:hypothetical protein
MLVGIPTAAGFPFLRFRSFRLLSAASRQATAKNQNAMNSAGAFLTGGRNIHWASNKIEGYRSLFAPRYSNFGGLIIVMQSFLDGWHVGRPALAQCLD